MVIEVYTVNRLEEFEPTYDEEDRIEFGWVRYKDHKAVVKELNQRIDILVGCCDEADARIIHLEDKYT